ncbi:MAG: hypothetical protein ACRCW1_10535 [Anaerotignaceae bacterium]
MKKTILYLALSIMFTLSACGGSGQSTTSSNDTTQSTEVSETTTQEDTETEIAETTEVPTTEAPATTAPAEVPAVYSELLNTYSTALKEKWDGGTLIENDLNLIALDLYEGAPLDSIGYVITDIDNNGTDELVIGTTAAVTDEFYSKMILDLYTIDADGKLVHVLSSEARNRYVYAGEQLFANPASNSATDSTNATMKYSGTELSDANKITDPANYVQMDLTPLSLWSVAK